ncbi:MAG: acylphosphatase [Chloroflexota bacterium]|nr:MAG: acylphosphatase [Chloroflexota bacterium]
MPEQENARLHAIVEGHVQGVGFRYFVVEKATSLGLNGWVRNRWDDTVEVVAEGLRPDLVQLLRAINRGPSGAYVSDVKDDWQPATGEYTRFQVIPSL